jgi:hypothetical protein
MYTETEKSQILAGIHDVIHALHEIPAEDFAYFLVKYDPKLADELANQIEYSFFDMYIQEDEKNAR